MARCRVCHRELTNLAHIAAGIGPICAAKVARRQAANELAQRTAYPAAKMERINRAVTRLATMIARFDAQRGEAARCGTPEQQREAQETYRLVIHWYGRWRMMQMRAQRMTARA